MKKYIGIFVLIIVFACVSFYCVALDEQDCIDNIKLVASIDGHTTKISLYKNNGKYYAFLPSHFQLEDAYFEYTSGCSLYLDDKEYSSSTLCSDLQAQKEYSMVIKNTFGFTTSEETLVIYIAKETPSIFIDLTNGTIEDINSDKTVEKTGTCLVIDSNNSVNYSGTFNKIHGRGSGTWVADKKPYNISFTKEVDLFGMGLATEWVLLSNPLDSSNLRNKIIYDFADEIGLEGSPDSRFVNLYIDDEYCGLYLLTEKVEIHQNRVDVIDLNEETKNLNGAPLNTYPCIETEVDGIYKKAYDIPVIPDDITGGYLLELQIYSYRNTFTSAFTTKDSICFSFKSSPYVSLEQMEYISGFIQDVENSFHTGNYEEYIDVDSWVKYYLVQEIFGNMDVRSFFYYKNSDSIDGKLYAGPVWDYDIALGSMEGVDNSQGFYINTWGWYSLLYKHDSFKASLTSEYVQTFKPALTELLDKILYEYQEEIDSSYVMDKYRWSKDTGDSFDTLESHIDHFRSFLTSRISFLDEVWIEGKQAYNITATSKPAEAVNLVKYYYSITPGEQIPQLPTLSVEGYKFLGWYDTATNEKYDPTEIPTSDKIYEAKWEVDPEYNQSNVPPTLIARISSIIRNNLQLFVALSGLIVMGIFVVLYFYIDYRSKKKEGSNVKSK